MSELSGVFLYLKEIDAVKNDYVREKGMLSAQLREKDNEVLVLSTRIAAIGTNQLDSSKRDLESRLQELTESLIHKQTTLEMLSSEKNSLYLQLEKTRVRKFLTNQQLFFQWHI